jgi:hypothetical protein
LFRQGIANALDHWNWQSRAPHPTLDSLVGHVRTVATPLAFALPAEVVLAARDQTGQPDRSPLVKAARDLGTAFRLRQLALQRRNDPTAQNGDGHPIAFAVEPRIRWTLCLSGGGHPPQDTAALLERSQVEAGAALCAMIGQSAPVRDAVARFAESLLGA